MKDEVLARFQLAAARVRAAAEREAAKPAPEVHVIPPAESNAGFTRSRIIRAKKH